MGEGQFGVVFIAYINMNCDIRNDDEIMPENQPQSITSGFKRRLSFVRRHYNPAKATSDSVESDGAVVPLIVKNYPPGTRKVAVKTVKGKFYRLLASYIFTYVNIVMYLNQDRVYSKFYITIKICLQKRCLSLEQNENH